MTTTVEDLREQVLFANRELARRELARFTFGNASAVDRASSRIVIKPSGVPYDVLRAADMVVTDLNGEIIEGMLKPSSDLPTHVALYRAFPEIGADRTYPLPLRHRVGPGRARHSLPWHHARRLFPRRGSRNRGDDERSDCAATTRPTRGVPSSIEWPDSTQPRCAPSWLLATPASAGIARNRGGGGRVSSRRGRRTRIPHHRAERRGHRNFGGSARPALPQETRRGRVLRAAVAAGVFLTRPIADLREESERWSSRYTSDRRPTVRLKSGDISCASVT